MRKQSEAQLQAAVMKPTCCKTPFGKLVNGEILCTSCGAVIKRKTEATLQREVMGYISKKYPKALAIHVPNEGKRNPRYAKSSGITAGVSDVLVFEEKRDILYDYTSLAIELKIRPNTTTPKQDEFMRKLEFRGWKTKVCYSFDEAKEIIDWYLKK